LRQIALRLVLCSALCGVGTTATAQDATPTAPDDTAVNARDRVSGAMTAGEQSNDKSDLELTRKIRRAIVKDHSLSMMAHNVKIMSSGGDVVLRGPVKTEEEKTIIAHKAQKIAGAGIVDDELEVKGQ
jgi:hyperosmotically inducible periplasmic protein